MSEIAPDGSMPLQGALQAFGVAFGTLPGVEVPAGAPEDVESGSLAIEWIVADWPQLSPEQQAAALTEVPELADAVPGGGTSTTTPSPMAARSSLIDDNLDPVRADVTRYFSYYLAQIGYTDPGWRPSVVVGNTSPDKPSTKAYAVGRPTGCRIVVTPKALNYSSSLTSFLIAHEVFHCIQAIVVDDTVHAVPAWIAEGAATWAGLQASGYAPGAGEAKPVPLWWDQYLEKPDTSLFTRTYDAFPFFTYLQNHGVNVWNRLARMSEDSAGFFGVLTDGDDVLKEWGTGYFRDSGLGSGWDMSGVGITNTKPSGATTVSSVGVGDTETLNLPPASAGVMTVQASADVVTITTTAPESDVRLGDGTEIVTAAGGLHYCNREDQCECPDGAEPSIHTEGQLPEGVIRVAASTTLGSAAAIVAGSDFNCETEPVPTAPTASAEGFAPGEVVGTWHLSELDTTTSQGTSNSMVAGGSAELVIASDGSMTWDYIDADIQLNTPGAKFDPLLNGHSDATLLFDVGTHSFRSLVCTGSVMMTVAGRSMTFSSADFLHDPTYSEHYSVDSSTMTWTAHSDDTGGTAVWHWVRG